MEIRPSTQPCSRASHEAEPPLSTSTEPIAIVGVGCRFPGDANDPESFWKLIAEGNDAIVDIPNSRWDVKRFYDPDINKPGKMYVRSGGFLKQDIEQFDAFFFGITPREAECLDPQQRILMEVAWEALEDAGVPPASLAGSDTGVYIGAFTLDNKLTQMSGVNRDLIGPHTAVGSTMTILSNRLSYCFDLRGPSVSVDTACSSSLVAFHYACEAIRNGDCSMAIAGGVNIIHRPEYMIAMCKGQFLSPDGHCKSFDARADGYARGEGAGIVLLKPLSSAIKDNDRIYALVRGTGVNQDGRTSGITVPNGESQEALVRQVCEKAGIALKDIAYVEAHGTGTPIGDPTEAGALGRALGENRSAEQPCYIGSVKANIGHLEAASGVAGLIKTALSLKKRMIPPLANLQQPNPEIPFEELGLKLPRQIEAMPVHNGRAYAGINSFGYGGTNAYALLEEAPVEHDNTIDSQPDKSKGPWILPLSARSEGALKASAQKYLNMVSEAKTPNFHDLCYSASVRRSHLEFRLAIPFSSKPQLIDQLSLFIDNQTSDQFSTAKINAGDSQQPVFVFAGMGPQWWAMGRELLTTNEVFRRTVEQCDKIFKREAGWSILKEMLATKTDSRIRETQIAQPANLAVQLGLLAVLDSWGIQPAAIVGHSVGEVSAAYAAGVLTLENAIKVSFHRGRVQSQAAGKGKMLAVGLSESDAVELLSEYRNKVSIAAINSYSTLTLAGDTEALEEIANKLESQGVFNRFLTVEVPYHSPAMELLKPKLREALADLKTKPPEVPLYSTVTGQRVEEASYDAEYWCDNVRQPVLFAKTMETILKDGHRVFIEIGPHPVLSTSIKETMMRNDLKGSVIPTLHREQAEQLAVMKALTELYTAGSPINWKKLSNSSSTFIPLPHYPWQRETYWTESEEALQDRLGKDAHPFLYQAVSAPLPTWESPLSSGMLPYLDDHAVDGVVVLPGAAYVETGLALDNQISGNTQQGVINLKFHSALVVDENDEPVLRVQYQEKTREYSIFSRTRDNRHHWTLHATGTLWCGRLPDAPPVDFEELGVRCPNTVDTNQLYSQLAQRGLQYGPWFQGIQNLWTGNDEVLAEIKAHGSLATETEQYRLHPSLLDACFQALICLLDGDQNTAYLPVEIDRITFFQRPQERFRMHGVLSSHSKKTIIGDIVLFDTDGNRLVEISGLRCQALSTGKQTFANRDTDWLYQFDWKPAIPQDQLKRTGNWLIFDDQGSIVEKLAYILSDQLSGQVSRVIRGDRYEQQQPGRYLIRQDRREDYQQLLGTVSNWDGIAYFWGSDQGERDQLPELAMRNTTHLLHLLKALENTPNTNKPRLYVVTRGVQEVVETDRMEASAQWPLIGLSRVAFNELPENRCTLVDLDGVDHRVNLNLLFKELLADNQEDDVALRDEKRYVHQLERTSIEVLEDKVVSPEPKLVSPNRSYEITGNRDQVFFRDCARRSPAPREIEIELHSVLLNSQDRSGFLSTGKNAQKTARSSGYSIAQHGFSGIVSRVGSGVDQFQIGDRLVGCSAIDLNSCVYLPSQSIAAASPAEGMDFRLLAAVPKTFVPIYYALSDRARLGSGETLLIHSFDNEFGLAAAKIGKALGAKVIATSGARLFDKLLASLSIFEILDPECIDFVEKVKDATGGKGADVVLNLSSADTGHNLFDVLAPFGRHIDFLPNNTPGDESPNRSQPSSKHLAANLTHIQVQPTSLIQNRPELFRKLLQDVMTLIQQQKLLPNPVNHFASNRLQDAFDMLNDESDTEQVILKFRDHPAIPVHPRVQPVNLISQNGSYLITGGFGGFGARIAHWLVEKGATQLVLVGRRGGTNPEAIALIEELEQKGANVLSLAADMTQKADVEKVMASVKSIMPPLHAVLHSAAILDDASLTDLDDLRLANVMAPKIQGAWNLHLATQHMPLKHFVMFSSVSGLIGNARQGNYVAANTFLDALALHRRKLGLSAIAVNWGAISSSGMAADNKDVEKHLELMGMNAFSAEQAMDAFNRIAPYEPVQLGIMDVSWQRWAQFEPTGGSSPRFIDLVVAESGSENQETDHALVDQLALLKPEARLEMLTLLLAEQISETLRMPSDKVDHYQPLTDMGVDSLLGVEVQTELNMRFGIELSTLELIKGNSIVQIAEIALRKLNIEASQSTDPNPISVNQLKVCQDNLPEKAVDELSDDALDELLEQLIVSERT